MNDEYLIMKNEQYKIKNPSILAIGYEKDIFTSLRMGLNSRILSLFFDQFSCTQT